MASKPKVSTSDADVLPYLRAALDALQAKQRKDSMYHLSTYAAPLLSQELQRHGLQVVAQEAKAPAHPARRRTLERIVTTSAAAEPTAKQPPLLIEYTHAETNKLVKAALAEQWPATRFLVRADAYGSTDVYYLAGTGTPKREEVQKLIAAFEGARTNSREHQKGWGRLCRNDPAVHDPYW